jgi:hypothetical protein
MKAFGLAHHPAFSLVPKGAGCDIVTPDLDAIVVLAGVRVFVGADSSNASTSLRSERSTTCMMFLLFAIRKAVLCRCLGLWARCVALQGAWRKEQEPVWAATLKFHFPCFPTRAPETPSRRCQCLPVERQCHCASALTCVNPDSDPSDLEEFTTYQRLQRWLKARRQRFCGLAGTTEQ